MDKSYGWLLQEKATIFFYGSDRCGEGDKYGNYGNRLRKDTDV